MMLRNYNLPVILALCCLLMFFGCSEETAKQKQEPVEPAPQVQIPEFSADSAYTFIEEQLAFGPRVPNTNAHEACAEALIAHFKGTGAKVQVQRAEVKAYTGQRLFIHNIIASYNPNTQRRVLLSAHWDTRHVSDQDAGPKDQPIPGANDGASGVAVLMEMARHFGQNMPRVGVDIFLWDAEDYGDPQNNTEHSFALGAQYWARNKVPAGYTAMYGINLDMVGAIDAVFYKEEFSRGLAPQVIDKVWNVAHEIGYGSYFPFNHSDPVVDDHFYVSQLGQIPCIDIIHQPNGKGFFPQWHTLGDDIDIISKESLKAVGQTVLTTVYRER